MKPDTDRPSLRPLEVDGGYVRELTLERIRCFGGEQTVQFRDPFDSSRPSRWTIIVGENGTGKTTILRALALLSIRSEDSFIHSLGAFGRRVNFFQRKNINSSSGDDIEDGRIRIITMGAGSVWRVPSNSHHSRREIKRESGPYKANVVGYGAGRAVTWEAKSPDGWISRQADESFESVGSLFESSFSLRNPVALLNTWNYSERVFSSENRSYLRWLIEAFQGGVLPGVSKIEFRPHPGLLAMPKVVFKAFSDVELEMDEMSLGYQVFAAFTADFASRLVEGYRGRGNPLDQPSICLVDEIDLHMHPAWQRTVMDELSRIFPSTQFIVTAHSPLFVQAAEGANLVLLRRDPKDPSSVIVENDQEPLQGLSLEDVVTSPLFGLKSAWPPSIEAMLERREQLQRQERRTAKEEAELAGLDNRALLAPTQGLSEDPELRRLLRLAAGLIEAGHDPSSSS